MNNNQLKPKRIGGPRPGSGRKPGTTNKLSGASILQEIRNVTGKKFERSLAEHYQRAIEQSDWTCVREYEKLFLSKVVADKTELDVTSGGEPIKANFTFPSVELPDWKK